MTFEPKEVTGLDMAFGGRMKELLPPMASIPEEFHRWDNGYWGKIVGAWFFSGLPQGTVEAWQPKPGIDKAKALRHVKAILGSFELKHEHKEAACAYLLSLWFEEPTP